MIYPYECICGHDFEVIKSIADIDNQEICPKCSSKEVTRYISRTHFYGASDWDKAEFNPGLGQVVRNGLHRKELCKRMGLEEVGSEPVKNIHNRDESERVRASTERWQKAKETALHGL